MNYQELEAKLAETTQSLEATKADLNAAQSLAFETQEKLDQVSRELESAKTLSTTLTEVNAQQETVINELNAQIQSVDQAAAAKLAAIGEEAVARGEVKSPDINEETPQALLEKYQAMEGREKTRFFRDNRERLLAAAQQN